MLDARLLPLQHRLLMPLARALAARGIGADQVTLAGFAVGLGAVALLAFGQFRAALLALALNRAADGLDGVLARLTRATDRGAFLDITLDFVFYALFPLGFALADPAQNALPAALLITSFMGTGSSFLAFAIIAAKQGRTAAAYPSKGIHYLGGLTEGAETIAVFAAMCLWPLYFPALAYLFASACTLTTVLRWHQGWIAFSKP
jgi:phosphatidylglycerophosphate synthase